MVKYTDYKVALEHLKNWLLTQPHLPIINDCVLEQFINCTTGDLEITKNLIDTQYCLRNNWPDYFLDRDPNSKGIQHIYNIVDIIILPGLTPEGWKITFMRLADCDPDKFETTDALKLFLMLFDTRMNTLDPDGLSKGEQVIFDANGFTLKHLAKCHLAAIRIFAKFNQEATSVKIFDIHVLNCPPFLDKVIAVFRPFITKEIFDMVKFHQPGSEALYDYVKLKTLLPKEYGGNADVKEIKKEIHKLLLENRSYLMDAKYWMTDENKRPNNQPRPLALEGNFKSLNVD